MGIKTQSIFPSSNTIIPGTGSWLFLTVVILYGRIMSSSGWLGFFHTADWQRFLLGVLLALGCNTLCLGGSDLHSAEWEHSWYASNAPQSLWWPEMHPPTSITHINLDGWGCTHTHVRKPILPPWIIDHMLQLCTHHYREEGKGNAAIQQFTRCGICNSKILSFTRMSRFGHRLNSAIPNTEYLCFSQFLVLCFWASCDSRTEEWRKKT